MVYGNLVTLSTGPLVRNRDPHRPFFAQDLFLMFWQIKQKEFTPTGRVKTKDGEEHRSHPPHSPWTRSSM